MEIFFNKGPGSLLSVFGSDREYWSQRMKTALGLDQVAGFPYQLSPIKKKKALPIPALISKSGDKPDKKIFNKLTKIYVTSDLYFTTKFREKYQNTKLRHTTSVEAKHWLGESDMKYWPQQLNFDVVCATQGCGISRDIFENGINLPPSDKSFLYLPRVLHDQAHFVPTRRHQSMSALPIDPTFNPL